MRIVVSSTGSDLEAQVSPVFGRCPVYLFVDTETMQYEAVPNPGASMAGGAGIQAAQFVIGRGAQAVLSGNVGPNAFQVFQTAGVPLYNVSGGTGRQAVEAFCAGQLPAISEAKGRVPAHSIWGMDHRGRSGYGPPGAPAATPGPCPGAPGGGVTPAGEQPGDADPDPER